MPEMPKQETGAAIFRLRGVGKEWSGFATVAGSGTVWLVRRRARPRGLRNEKLRLGPSLCPENNSHALLLGGAAVHRCENCPVLCIGFSRRGQTVAPSGTFSPTVKGVP